MDTTTMPDPTRPNTVAMLAEYGMTPEMAAAAIGAERVEMPVGDRPNASPPDLLGMLRELGISPDTVCAATIGEPADPNPDQRRFVDLERRVGALERAANIVVPALKRAGFG
jgi:hypothetical protein